MTSKILVQSKDNEINRDIKFCPSIPQCSGDIALSNNFNLINPTFKKSVLNCTECDRWVSCAIWENRDSEIGLWLPNCTRCAHTILLTTANFRTLFFPNSTTDPPITYTNYS